MPISKLIKYLYIISYTINIQVKRYNNLIKITNQIKLKLLTRHISKLLPTKLSKQSLFIKEL